jgi:hypothetical protein
VDLAVDARQNDNDVEGFDVVRADRRARLTGPTFFYLSSAYVVSRALVYGVAQVAFWLTHRRGVQSLLAGWDSQQYMTIAAKGYGGRNVNGFSAHYAFFPGWPLLLRVTHWVFRGSFATDGLILAFVLGFVAVLAIWLAVAVVFDAESADRTALLFMFLPAAFVLSMVYSEPLFVAMAALCLYALQRKWWLVAGFAAAAAGATRAPGTVLFACCAIAAIIELRRNRSSWSAIVAPIIAPVGFGVWALYQWRRVGSAFAFVDAERRGWGNGNSWGTSVLRSTRDLFVSRNRFHTPWPLLVTLSTVLFVSGIVILIIKRREVPVVWIVYSVGIAAFALSVNNVWPIPRFLMPAFPALAALVQRLPARVYTILLVGSAGLMVLSAMLLLTPAKLSFPAAP